MNSQSSKCDVPDHELEDILGLCFDKNCISNPEFCYLCKTEGKHQDHQSRCKYFTELTSQMKKIEDIFIQLRRQLLETLETVAKYLSDLLNQTYQKKIDDCSMLKTITKEEKIQESKEQIELLEYYQGFDRETLRTFIDQVEEICNGFKGKIDKVIKDNEIPFLYKSSVIELQNFKIQVLPQQQNLNFQQESQVSNENAQIANIEQLVNFTQQQNAMDEDDAFLQLQIQMIQEQELEQQQQEQFLNMQKSEELTQQAKLNRNHSQTLKLLDEAIQLFENNEEALLLKGKILFDQEKFDESIKPLEKFIQLNSKLAPAHSLYAQCLQRLNRLQEADKFYQKAIENNRNESSLFSNRANVLNLLGKHQEAINFCDQAIVLNPQNSSAYNNKAFALQHLNKLDEALDIYEKAFQINPTSTDILGNKGSLLIKMNRISDAVVCLQQMELIPEKTPHYFNFKTTLLINQVNYADARSTLQQGLQFYPNEPTLLQLKQQYGF